MTKHEPGGGQEALFGLPEMVLDEKRAGRAERALQHALEAGYANKTIGDTDAALAAAALVGARAIDSIDNMEGKAAYAFAAAATPYREMLHALRLPEAVEPATSAAPAGERAPHGVPDWLTSALGTAE